MTVEEVMKKFDDLTVKVDAMKKDYDLKLDSANKEAQSWKKVAEQKQDEIASFKESTEKEIKDREKQFAEMRAAENLKFAEELVAKDVLTPALKDTAVRLMSAMTSEKESISYQEKDGKKVSHTMLSLFKEFISALPKGNRLKAITNRTAPKVEIPSEAKTGTEDLRYMEVHRGGKKEMLPVEGDDLHSRALEFQQEQKKIGRVVSYGDALIAAEIQISQEAAA